MNDVPIIMNEPKLVDDLIMFQIEEDIKVETSESYNKCPTSFHRGLPCNSLNETLEGY